MRILKENKKKKKKIQFKRKKMNFGPNWRCGC